MKNRSVFMFYASVVFLMLIALPHTSGAEDSKDDNQWTAFYINMTYSGNSFSKERRDKVDVGEIVHTSSTTTSGLLFSCVNGSLMVAVSLKPQDLSKTFQKTTRRHKGRRVEMSLDDGAKIDLGTWILKPSLGGLSSLKTWQAAKLYNAVVRQQKITLFVQRKKPVVLDTPKTNSIFAEFGGGCGLGKNR